MGDMKHHGGVQVSTGVLKPEKRAAVSQSALKGETLKRNANNRSFAVAA